MTEDEMVQAAVEDRADCESDLRECESALAYADGLADRLADLLKDCDLGEGGVSQRSPSDWLVERSRVLAEWRLGRSLRNQPPPEWLDLPSYGDEEPDVPPLWLMLLLIIGAGAVARWVL